MKRFLLLPTAFLLPCACISVNTAAQTLNAGTVYRNWELDDRAYVKNGFVYIKAVQCDQRKETLDNRSDTVIAFEGFMDFLAYLSLKYPERLRIDAAVLNSVVNLPGRHRQNPELLRRLQQRDFRHGAHAGASLAGII